MLPALLAVILALSPCAPEPSPAFVWPVDGPVVRAFDPPARDWMPGHRGVDLAAAPLTPVRAAGCGTVAFAGWVAARPLVSIEHPNGLRTTYEPIQPAVAAGQEVVAGEIIGYLLGTHPGCPGPACLHWGLRRGDVYLDPLALVTTTRVRLLPL